MESLEVMVARRIRERRRSLGWTQKLLADKLSYSEQAISKWENGGGLPPSALLPKLAKVLGLSIDELFAEENTVSFYLGIDGGGTKTEFLLCDQRGAVITKVVLGSSNHNDIGMDRALDCLRTGIVQACGNLSYGNISIFAGIAGGETGEMIAALPQLLESFHFGRTSCGSDAKNAVAAALKDDDGVVMILGTGSIVFVRHNGALHRIGGYGQWFSDSGSGYEMGREAILAALRREDGSGGRPRFTKP